MIVRTGGRRLRVPALLLASVLLGPLAVAGPSLDERINLDLEDAPLQRIFDMYGEILNVELQIDPTLEGNISITFDNITVRTSLNAICESAGCKWEWIDGDPGLLRIERDDNARQLVKVPRVAEKSPGNVVAAHAPEDGRYGIDSPISLKLIDANATTVLEIAAKVIEARLLMDRELAGEKVTINATEVPLSKVLDTICTDLGCEWKLREGVPATLEVHCP